MKRLQSLVQRAARQHRGRIGIAALSLVIAAGSLGVAAVAFAHQGTPVVPLTQGGTGSPSAPATSPALCSSTGMQVSVESTEGAAGTIRYVWRARNVSGEPCRSFGYPGMDVHGTDGWLNLQVHRGGFPDINQAPKHILVAPGRSLHFVSYWSDVTTDAGSCTEFDQVKVTLPDNRASNVISVTGCLTPTSVDVGTVTTRLPTS